MAKNRQPEEAQNQNIVSVVLIVVCVVIIAIFFFTMIKSGSENKEFKLSPTTALSVANARKESAQNALDGKGNFTDQNCNELKSLAQEFDSSSEYFSSCDSSNSLYLSTPDTSNRKILILSDENYTAKFTFDNDLNILYDYSFLDFPTGGFNSFGGRE